MQTLWQWSLNMLFKYVCLYPLHFISVVSIAENALEESHNGSLAQKSKAVTFECKEHLVKVPINLHHIFQGIHTMHFAHSSRNNHPRHLLQYNTTP